ncbi:MAG TPA: magnesium-translocating P-type ATPase [Mycobacteriales bacterium]|nr:magnesium-translocating P-type ATPase [Mycobacteriales bacterium]
MVERARPEPASDAFISAGLTAADVAERLGVELDRGLSAPTVALRQQQFGPNAFASHHTRFFAVLWRQLRSPLLVLLLAAAVASYFVGERTDAVIITVILALSVGLGFMNELRAERAAEALHSAIRHRCLARRDGRLGEVDVTDLVPGDVVELRLGDVVPADLRLVATRDLECDESVLTGESLPVAKDIEAVPSRSSLAELTCCALMGTVVHSGGGRGVVVATGRNAEFGRIAAGLNTRQLETEFQRGLRRFSLFLVYVAAALTTSIFVINVVLGRPVIDALLFSLAIAVGITPQLLPAVVSTSLAAGSRRMRQRKVLVKRLVCIEDLGDVETLFTDKTGTLTIGRVEYMRAVPVDNLRSLDVLRWGLLATEVGSSGALGSNALDRALWDSPATTAAQKAVSAMRQVAVLPFDHERRLMSVLVEDSTGQRTLVTKGAPEAVVARCAEVTPDARAAMAAEFSAGNRVVAVATRLGLESSAPTVKDESELTLAGFLVFLDPAKPDAAQALSRLDALGISVKVVTGDNPEVAAKICGDLGLVVHGVLTGPDIDELNDAQLARQIDKVTVFARVSPEHKARIVRIRRHEARGVAFLGDGVNDALALHAADVGISVDSATDVAKDAADAILLEKDLDVLADGVAEGRRIFANTIKYVLMGTSSNFGNMFSAAGASLFLSFLPMLPSQILLNNLLYDTSQLAIPTDHVDGEQVRRPSHWDIAFIRRFMLVFGPISSVFDFATFAIMLRVFHSGPEQFRSGWFVESLATQTLVIFAIRTRRVPFFRSRPSLPLALSALVVVGIGAALPASRLASPLGFTKLPTNFFVALVAMVVCYLALIEVVKRWFYARSDRPHRAQSPFGHRRRQRRRAARFGAASTGPRERSTTIAVRGG